MENCAIEDRVVRYWTIRSHDFGAVRKNELGSIMGRRWQEELEAQLPERSPLNILDVGTGTGFFAILMAKLGHKVTGIDLTPAMLEEAGRHGGRSWAGHCLPAYGCPAAGFPGRHLRCRAQPESDVDAAGTRRKPTPSGTGC